MPPPVRTKEIVNADGKMEKLVELRLRRNVTLNKNNSMSSEDPSSASLSEASCGVQLEEELHSDCSHDRMTLSAKYLHENRGKVRLGLDFLRNVFHVVLSCSVFFSRFHRRIRETLSAAFGELSRSFMRTSP